MNCHLWDEQRGHREIQECQSIMAGGERPQKLDHNLRCMCDGLRVNPLSAKWSRGTGHPVGQPPYRIEMNKEKITWWLRRGMG